MSAPLLEVTGLTLALPDPSGPGASRGHPGTPQAPARGWVYPLVDVHVALRPGRVTALVGESGAGKSMLISALTGLLPPGAHHAGTVRLHERADAAAPGPTVDLLGASEADLARHIRGRRIGVIPQSASTSFTPVRTVRAQLLETLTTAAGRPSRQSRWGRLLPRAAAGDAATAARSRGLAGALAAVATAAGLDDVDLDVYPHQMSGGQVRRAAIAAGLAAGADVLLADEPTVGLDPPLVARVTDHLRALARQGRAVLLVTHDLRAAAASDDVLVLRAGHLIEAGPAASVLGAPAHPYTRALVTARPTALHQERP